MRALKIVLSVLATAILAVASAAMAGGVVINDSIVELLMTLSGVLGLCGAQVLPIGEAAAKICRAVSMSLLLLVGAHASLASQFAFLQGHDGVLLFKLLAFVANVTGFIGKSPLPRSGPDVPRPPAPPAPGVAIVLLLLVASATY